MAEEKKKTPKAKTPRKAKKDAYKVEGGKLTRVKVHCPKCGPGVFLAQHADRAACGKCGYTEFKKK